jgi:hypothetical protein
MLEKIKKIFDDLNKKGIAIPMLRDSRTGEGSVTMTMMIISFNTCLFGQLGKFAKILGSVDLSQANYLFLITSGLYLGRKLQKIGDKVEVESEEKKAD